MFNVYIFDSDIDITQNIFCVSKKLLKYSTIANSLYNDRTTEDEPIPLIKMIPEDIEILNTWLSFISEPDYEITPKDFIFLDFKFEHLDLFEALNVNELIRIFNFAFANQILVLAESCAKILSLKKIKFFKSENTNYIKVIDKDYRNRDIKETISKVDNTAIMMILKYKPVKTIIKQDDELLKLFKYNPTFETRYDSLFSVETNYVNKFSDMFESSKKFVLKNGTTSQLSDDRVIDIVHKFISDEEIPKDAETFNVPTTIRAIGDYAFENCTLLNQIVLGNQIMAFGDSCFKNCPRLVNINMPTSLNIIGHSSFKDCSALMSLDLPNGVKVIMNEAFANCTSLTNITIPETIEYIGQRAFRNTNLNEELKTNLLNKYSELIF